MASFDEVFQAKEQIARNLLKRKDVFGVGVGYYDPKNPKKGAGIIIYSNQQPTSQPTVSASSSSKKESNTVTTKINGKTVTIPIRIVKNDSFKANVSVRSTNFTRKIRPVRAGYSVGTTKWSGTAGLIVTNYPGRNRLYVASNNHVLNLNNTNGYTETVQPGGADGGKSGRDRIGRLYRFVKLRKSNNYLDAAISIPLRNSLLTPKYALIGNVKGHYANYRIGARFIKVGRTTGLVGGVVESINTDLKINYGTYGKLGSIYYKNQTIIRSNQPISLPGDSGSVWLDSRNFYATAVNYAGTSDGKLSVSYPIHWLMQAFRTRVAVPGLQSGYVIQLKGADNSYTQPLSTSELASIKIL